MDSPREPRSWQRVAQIALLGLAALATVPFILVALFGAAGGRR